MLKRTLLSLIFLGLLGCHHDEKDNAASQAPPNNLFTTTLHHLTGR
jgi:glycerophosphoryl diester phosphodiesterase